MKPESTLSKVLPLAKKIGITRLANVTGLDSIGMPTWLAVRPLAKSLTVSQGKGITHDLAKVSAVMESIELYHAEEFVPNGIFASITEAAKNKHDFVNPLFLPLIQADSVDVNDQFEWVQATGLFTDKKYYIPRHMACLGNSLQQNIPTPFISSSNGLASGNDNKEAILHAALEVIERDQLSFWLVKSSVSNSKHETRVNLKTIDNSTCQDLVADITSAGLKIAIWYVTTTVDIPVFVCTIFDSDHKTAYSQRASGYGCHPYKHIALSRAITEAVQSRLTHISGSRDDSGWLKYEEELPISSSINHRWLSDILVESAKLDYTKIRQCKKQSTAEGYLADIQDQLYKNELGEILVLDLTQDALGINVCHITIPNSEFNANKEQYTPGARMINFLESARNG